MSSYVPWIIFLGIVLLALWAATSTPAPFPGATVQGLGYTGKTR